MPAKGFVSAIIWMNFNTSRGRNPPGSGQPVPGTNAASKQSTSKLSHTASTPSQATSSARFAAVSMPISTQSVTVMIVVFRDYVPPFLSGVGLAALMAAILSTASTLFVLTGFGLSRDLYENLRRGAISEKQRMLVSRLGQVVIGVIVAVIAISRPAAIYWVSIYAGAIFGVGWLPSVVAGLEWRRMNHRAAIASMVLGVGGFILISELTSRELITLPAFLNPLTVSFVISVAALIVTGLVTRPSDREVLYYRTVRAASLSAATIQRILAGPGGVAELRREYRGIQRHLVVSLVLAALLCAYGLVNLGYAGR